MNSYFSPAVIRPQSLPGRGLSDTLLDGYAGVTGSGKGSPSLP